MNLIFFVFIVFGIIVSIFTGRIDMMTNTIIDSANLGVEKMIGFIGVMSLWLGISKIAEESGFLELITKIIGPIIGKLFPKVPKKHPAMGAILMNISANLMGFGSAATPFGLRAMEELQKINPKKDTASESMCTFLAINTASVTLIPATIIAFRAAAGSANPSEIIGTTILATFCSSTVAIIADILFRNRHRKSERYQQERGSKNGHTNAD